MPISRNGETKMIIYDADNQILGRLCSVIAKKLLEGEKVAVVNSEKAVLAGNSKSKQEFYLKKYHRGDALKGPFFPKQPDLILRRTVRGMIPWDRNKGRKAYKNLKVFIGLPDEFKNKKLERIEGADASKLKGSYTTLGNISISIGAKKKW
jgi:large subunit ribosomal protein L13